MNIFTFVVINLFVALDCHGYSEFTQDNAKVGSIPGDYIIGALFPLHESKNYSDCANANISEYGIQIVEAAFFAIEYIKRNKTILPDVSLGIEIKGYCNMTEVAKDQSQKFIDSFRRKISEDSILSNRRNRGNRTPLIGIIGPEGHELSRVVGNVLNFFDIVQMTYSEPLPRITHPYSFSLIPGTTSMIDAIFELLIDKNWTYISVVYSEDLLDATDLRYFKTEARLRKVCIGDRIETFYISGWAKLYKTYETDEKKKLIAESIKPQMLSLNRVSVIICFCSLASRNDLFYFLHNYSTKRFVVISGDGWHMEHADRFKNQDEAVGEIRVSLEQDYVKEFDDYFLNLELNTNNSRNPWFAEFKQHLFINNKTLGDGYKQNPKVPYVIKSVFIFAHALRNMLKDRCENISAENFSKENFNEDCFAHHVYQSAFDFYGKPFKFGDDLTPKTKKYNFNNFQRFENGSYGHVNIGEYIINAGEENRPKFLLDSIVYPGNETVFHSTCRMPCPEHHTQIPNSEDHCCWQCLHCEPLEKIVEDIGQCEKCPEGLVPAYNKTSCIDIADKPITWNDTQTLISLVFSSTNILLAIFTTYVFLKYKNTPVVKSSTKELCYMMLFGIIFANLTPFKTLRIQNNTDCIVVRTLPPICFTFIYAALLIKTNRIARIFEISQKKFPNLNPRFLSLKAQITFAIFLIIIEVLICLYSLWKHPAEFDYDFLPKDVPNYKIKICSLTEEKMLEAFIFISVLILICTYYAVKTRNLPENFNEAKYIGFAMYATILTDVSFGFIYFETENKALALNLSISVNTLIVLVFLFAPKLYVILRVPEKNTRANFITTTSIRCFIASHQNRMNKSIEHNK